MNKIPLEHGVNGAGEIHTVIIIKIAKDFSNYELENKYLEQYIDNAIFVTHENTFENGDWLFWYIMGYEIINDKKIEFSRRIIGIDKSTIENGFIIDPIPIADGVYKNSENLLF